MKRSQRKRKKISERIICFILTIELCLGGLPISENGQGIIFSFIDSLTAHAADYEFMNVDQLVEYSKNYDSSHKNDTIKIVLSDSATAGGLNEFKKMGTSTEDAFNGKIILSNPNIPLNLPTAMFGYITDDVKIVDNSENAVELTFTRIQDRDDQPLFADHVINTRSSGSPVEWKFRYDRFIDPANDNAISVQNFSGFIGTLEANAKVNVSSAVLNNSASDKTANIVATNDAGLVCCTMQTGSELSIGTITIGTNGNSSFDIQSKSGNAGGIVGSMASGSKLTLGNSLANPQGAGQNITAANGYSGGIVGKCEEGTIEINNTAPYSLSQVINGKNGAGGICGYYKTKTSENVTVSSDKFTYSGLKVNGSGNCGGLFGTLVNNGGSFTVNGSSAVTADHSGGDASSLGGLIGSYSAGALTDSLTISTTGTVTPSKSGGTASIYGGAVGIAVKDSYIRLNGLTVNASDAAKFGGAVGSANGAFIDVNGLTVTAAPDNYSGGGVVNVLGNGVLRMNGAINLSNAKANDGQIVNTRDYGLVFAESGWTLTRRSDSAHVDDIGSWGEVLRFGTLSQSDIFDNFSDGDHSVTLKPAVLSMTNTTDFVKTALNIQLNKTPEENEILPGVLVCDSGSRSDILLASQSLELNSSSVAVDLSGTGITGLTRDSGEHCVEFTGTFNGNGGSIKLAVGESYFSGSGSERNGKIYNHSHIGLFAKTKNAAIQNLKISENSSINVCADSAMYIGNVIGQASGNLTLYNIEVCSSGNNYAAINAGGSTASSVGGLIGDIGSGENAAAGTVLITGCTYDGEIKGNITESNIGGMIGSLKGGTVTLGSSYVKGKITAASGNKVGGTIAVTNGSNITLNSLSVNGLNMTVSGDSGGFLGHKWLKTEAEFTGFTVNGSASLTSGTAAASGLVQTASGYWKVNGGGITLDSTMSVTASSAASFGLLVNDGTKLYLELLPSAYTAGAAMTFSLGNSLTVFDELVAHSASGDILSNGQGIVSIGTTGHALLKMDSYGGSTKNTYQHQTNYLGSHTDLYDNPNTRYYYNLDAYNKPTPDTDARKLLMWSVRQYAHEDIQKYFKYKGTIIGSSADTSLDMAGYSYYPVDLTGSLTLKGAVHLYNAEFDTTENSAGDKRLSTESGTQSQHYTIHNSLFRNVSGSLDFTGSIDGNLRKIGDYCGALIMGNVGSDQPIQPAKTEITVHRPKANSRNITKKRVLLNTLLIRLLRHRHRNTGILPIILKIMLQQHTLPAVQSMNLE